MVRCWRNLDNEGNQNLKKFKIFQYEQDLKLKIFEYTLKKDQTRILRENGGQKINTKREIENERGIANF